MKILLQVFSLFIILLTPVTLVLLAVGILLTPIYIQIEYRIPGFPEDQYGFSFEERLYWANISRMYILNNEGIEFLANQQLEEDTPLYNERELLHMYDVKVVVKYAMVVLLSSLLFLIGFGFWSKNSSHWKEYRLALSWGGWLTIGIMAAIFIYLALNFNSLFTNFHRIFFEGDTWLFRYSDTLIRLFPLQFWRDAFVWIGVMTLAGGLGLGLYRSK